MKQGTTYQNSVIPLKIPTTVTRKGQITIPAPIREALAIKEGDTITVSLHGEQVTLTPFMPTLAEGYQSIPALPSSLSLKDIRRIALDDHAEEIMRKG